MKNLKTSSSFPWSPHYTSSDTMLKTSAPPGQRIANGAQGVEKVGPECIVAVSTNHSFIGLTTLLKDPNKGLTCRF